MAFVVDLCVEDARAGRVVAVLDTECKVAAQPSETDMQKVVASDRTALFGHVPGVSTACGTSPDPTSAQRRTAGAVTAAQVEVEVVDVAAPRKT